MVLEGIVVDILNRSLGDYFKNLDTSQVKLGLWGGDVVLKDLSFRDDVMDNLGLPFSVIVGKVGTLNLKLPWQNLYTAPVEMKLMNLFLLVTPSYNVKYDADAEKKSEHAAKEKQLARLDEIRAQQRLKLQTDKNKKPQEDTFAEKLITQIIKNIQIHIDSIHIRYEDDVTKPASPFGCGITLKSLHIETCNENWVPAIITETVETVNKMTTLEGLSLYWDSKTELIQNLPSKSDMIDELRNLIDTEKSKLKNIVRPITSRAKILLTANPERGSQPFSKPRFWIDLVIEELGLGLTNLQFHDILELIEALDFMMRAQFYRKHRPNAKAHHGHYKQWWFFAYQCILEEQVRRKRQNWTWLHMQRHRNLCRVYADAYYKKLTQKKIKEDTKQQLTSCENELDVFNISLVRKQVEVKIEREGNLQSNDKQSGWFSGWFGGSGADASEPKPEAKTVGDIANAMTPEEKAKLYEAIDYSENALPLEFPDEYEEYQLNFRLHKLVVTVQDVKRRSNQGLGQQILNLVTNIVDIKLATRPFKNGMRVNVRMGSLEAEGLQGNDTHPPKIMSSKTTESQTNLLKLDFENNPLDSKAGQRIRVEVQPIQVVYHGKTVISLVQCFSLPPRMQLRQLQAAAVSTINEWREQSASGLQHLIHTRGEIDVDIDLKAPYILVPKDGKLGQHSSVLIVDLGELKLRSRPRDKTSLVKQGKSSLSRVKSQENPAQEQEYMDTMKKAAYDTFIIELKEFQVLFALPGEEFISILAQDKISGVGRSMPLTLLKSSELMVQLDQSLIPDDPRFAKIQVTTKLPLVQFEIPEHRLIHLVNLIVTLPLPKSSSDPNNPVFVDSDTQLDQDASLHELLAATRLTYMEMDLPRTFKKDEIEDPNPESNPPEIIQAIELLVSVSIGKIKIRISRSISHQSYAVEPMMALEMHNLTANLVAKTFETNLEATLGDISMMAFGPESGKSFHLIQTPPASGDSNGKLLQISIATVTPDCPKIHSMQIKQHISLRVSILEATLHREVLQSVVTFFDKLGTALAQEMSSIERNIEEQRAEIELSQKAKGFKERKQKSRLALHTEAVAKKFGGNPNEVLMKLEAHLDNFTVKVATKQKNIMKMVMSNLNLTVIQLPAKQDIFLDLKKFNIINLDSLSAYPHIIATDERIIHVHIVKYNEQPISTDQSPPDLTKCSMHIQIRTGAAKVHILSSFLYEIISFSTQFQSATQAVKQTSVAAAEAARKNVQDIYSANNTRIVLDIELKAPQIVLPENDRSLTAIMFDFGNLKFQNAFSMDIIKGSKGTKYAVIENMEVSLNNVIVSRVLINPTSQHVDCEVQLLDPVKFSGYLKRNMSSKWYSGKPGLDFRGTLHSTVARLSSEDYEVVLGCIMDKLTAISRVTEKGTERLHSDTAIGLYALEQSQAAKEKESAVARLGTGSGSSSSAQDTLDGDGLNLAFDLHLNNLGVVLYQGSSRLVRPAEAKGKVIVQRDPNNSLAEFHIDYVTTKVSVSRADNVSCSVKLGNIDLKDSRSNRDKVRGITQLINRKDASKTSKNKNKPDPSRSSPPPELAAPMIQFQLESNPNDGASVTLVTTSLTFLLCLDHVVQIMKFITPKYRIPRKKEAKPISSTDSRSKFARKTALKPHDGKELKGLNSPSLVKMKSRKKFPESEAPVKPIRAKFKLDAMEFVFVENMDSIHTNAVLLNLQMSLNVAQLPEGTNIEGTIDGLQLNTCNFNPEHRSQSLAEVISPITVTILGKESTNATTGLEIEVAISDIFVRLSAGTVELLSKIADSFVVSPSTLEEARPPADYGRIWEKKVASDLDLWYLMPGAVEERNCAVREMPEGPRFDDETLPVADVESSYQKLLMKSGSIVLTFEAGSEIITAPLLLIEASLNLHVIDWSENLEIGGGIQLAAAYFNAAVGMWEYLLEPVSKGMYRSTTSNPLELLFTVNQGETDEFSKLVREAKSSLVCVHEPVASESDLNETPIVTELKRGPETVVSLHCGEVIEVTLSRMTVHVLQMLVDTFNMARKPLVSHKKEISTAPYLVENFTGHEFVFDLDNTPYLGEEIGTGEFLKRLKVPSGSHMEIFVEKDFNRHSIMKEHQTTENQTIRAFSTSLGFQTKIPISKAETRSFSLSDGSTLVTDIWVKDCSRVITFRSCVQLINELNVSVDVLTKEMEHITTLPPQGPVKVPFSIPLKYMKSEGFHFAPARFRQSSEQYVLPAAPKSGLRTVSYLSCNDFVGKQVFYVKVVAKSRQLLHENSNRLSLRGWNHTVRLEPTFLINNMLPVPIGYMCHRSSDSSDLKEHSTAERGQMIQVTNLPADSPSFELSLRVKNYEGHDWDSKIVITSKTEKLSAWPFMCTGEGSGSGSTRTLTLGVHKEFTDRQYILHVYAPFWMINRTGLNLSYKSEKAKEVVKHPTQSSIVVFSYPASDVFNKSNKASMKPDEGDWCAPFPTETVGLSSFLKCKSFKKDYHFGLSIKMCHGGLTKMIVFSPKFYVMNQCSFSLLLIEGSEPELFLTPSLCSPFWPKGADPRLKVGIEGFPELTESFLYEIGHSTLLRLNNRYGGIQVDVNVSDTRIVITFSEYSDGKAPNLIVNLTQELILGFRQEGQDMASQGVLGPSECQLITWPDPTKPRNLKWYPLIRSSMKPAIKEFQDTLVADSYLDFEMNGERYFWISYVEDAQRVSVLTKNNILAKYLKSSRDMELPTVEIVLMFSGLGVSLVDNLKCKELIYLRISSAGLIWEQETAPGKLRPFSKENSETLEGLYQSYGNIKLPGTVRGSMVGHFRLDNGMEVDMKAMKMLQPHKRALRRSPRQPGLWTHLKIFPHSMQCHLRLNRLQIDNQLPDATFVFLLSPVAVTKSVAVNESEARKPFVELVLMQEKNAHGGGIQCIYCSLLVQEFHVKVDMGLISAIGQMFSQTGHAKIAKTMEHFRNDYTTATMPLEDYRAKTVMAVGTAKRFFSYLHLSPLKVKLSFSMNGSSNDSSNVFLILLQGLGIDKLADFQDVPFQLACFELQAKLLSDDQLGSMVTSHYATQGIKQFYVLILGLDFLGNPYLLVSGITEGIGAFFYEPIQGAILGPEAFKEGLSLGVRSLVGHTVGGAADALSKVTGTIGKGFAAMSMDSEFQRQRNEAMRQGPQATSFSTTAKGFWKSGILDTVAGIVTNPIKGAQEEGIQGFGKGLLRGVIGVVTRPAAGVADLTRGTLDSFRRALQDGDGIDQMRPPRPVQCSAPLQPYNMHAGKGYQIMTELTRKHRSYLKQESYVTHIVADDYAILITDRRAFFLKLTDAYGGSSVQWEHEWSDFEIPPYVVEGGAEFLLKPPPGSKARVKAESMQLYVPIHDPETCMWILNDIEELMSGGGPGVVQDIYDDEVD